MRSRKVDRIQKRDILETGIDQEKKQTVTTVPKREIDGSNNDEGHISTHLSIIFRPCFSNMLLLCRRLLYASEH